MFKPLYVIPARRACRLLPVLVAAVIVLPASAAVAASATFSGRFEAERSVQWEQPRGVNLIDCHGQHYSASNGDDRTSIKTRSSFKVVATGVGRTVFWRFGSMPNAHDPLDYGVEAHGVSTRSYSVQAGTTGGWCGSAEINPQPKNDCGTRLPVYQLAFSAGRGAVTWSASFAQRENERFDFYNCLLITPKGMYAGSFPTLPGKLPGAAVFNRRQRTIVVSAAKNYGPTATPSPNLGVDVTSHGRVTWRLTLTRVR
jgi:hypothetical protein